MRPAAAVGVGAGPVRQALLQVLKSGISGTFDVLAGHAGVDPGFARSTLKNLRREGVAAVHPAVYDNTGKLRGVGRPRAVYGPRECDSVGAFDALSFTRQVWR